jgi:apolipoprotein N-acyltransferase
MIDKTISLKRLSTFSLLSLLAGLTHAIALATPWDGQPLWWLQLISMTVLVMLLERTATAPQSAWLGGLFALAWLCGSVWWLWISMHVYGGLPAPLAALALVLLCGFLSLYYAGISYVYQRFRQRAQARSAIRAMVFASLWMFAELARDTWLTGFPWGAAGYAHIDGPLAGYAPWLGVYGVGFVAAWIAACLAQFHSCSRWMWACVFALLVLPSVAVLEGRERGQSQGVTDIALLQGNIAQSEKFQANTGIRFALDWYQAQLLGNRASLVVTPETALPLLAHHLPKGYWEPIQKHYAQSKQAAIIGIALGDVQTAYTNSVLGLKPNQAQPYQYDKHHLVPFGEFIPPLFKWFTQMMNIPLGDFKRGPLSQPSFEWAGQRWAPNICYEDLFGDELARRFVHEKTAPTVMVNVSNIAWFGNTVAIDQHLQISRMRSLELGRPMVRATNTGATVIINHRGEVTHSLPRHTRGVLTGSVEGRTGLTPYAWWAGRLGLWPLWVWAIAVISIALCIGQLRAKTSTQRQDIGENPSGHGTVTRSRLEAALRPAKNRPAAAQKR